MHFTAHGPAVHALMLLYAQLEQRKHSTAELLPIVVFSAFSVEAYLNALGSRSIAFWDQIERTPWRQKVEILHANAGQKADWGKDPLQFAAEIFKLRDRLAHGRPEDVFGEHFSDPGEASALLGKPLLQPNWFRAITEEWALDSKERFTALMVYLGGLYGHHESDHLHSASGELLVHDGAAG